MKVLEIIVRLSLPILCLAVFLPAGHAAAPMGLFFVRFLNGTATSVLEWMVLLIFVGGCSFLYQANQQLKPGSQDYRFWYLLVAIGSYAVSIGIAFSARAEQEDLVLLVTGTPFCIASCVAIYLQCYPPVVRPPNKTPWLPRDPDPQS